MQVTFFSFIMSVLWSSILVIGIYICRKKHIFFRQFGISSIVLLYLFCVIRTILPIDFYFSKGIYFSGIFTRFYSFVCLEKVTIFGLSISIFNVFVFLWVIVAIILLLKFIIKYKKIMKETDNFKKCDIPFYDDILLKVKDDVGKHIHVDLLQSPYIHIPMGIGIIHKKIILPEKEYDDSRLYYILFHEYMHFINKDLMLKFMVQILCCIFWWNPFIYLLRLDLGQTLEIKCDLSVTENMSLNKRGEYLTSIVSIIKEGNRGRDEKNYGVVYLITDDADGDIIERFHMILDNNPIRGMNRRLSLGWFSAMILIMCLSYIFVIQPIFDPPQSEIITGPGMEEILTVEDYILNLGNKYYIILPENERMEITEEQAYYMNAQGFEIRKGE